MALERKSATTDVDDDVDGVDVDVDDDEHVLVVVSSVERSVFEAAFVSRVTQGRANRALSSNPN